MWWEPGCPVIVISSSAFKHGYTAKDVQAVFDTCIYNSPLKDRDDIEMMLVFSVKGELLE
jgi:hypothetical protein